MHMDRASKTSIHAWIRDTDACDISFLHQIIRIHVQPERESVCAIITGYIVLWACCQGGWFDITS